MLYHPDNCFEPKLEPIICTNSTVQRTGAFFFLLMRNQGRRVSHLNIVHICAVKIRLTGDSIRERHTVTRRTSKGYRMATYRDHIAISPKCYTWSFQKTVVFVVY